MHDGARPNRLSDLDGPESKIIAEIMADAERAGSQATALRLALETNVSPAEATALLSMIPVAGAAAPSAH